MKKFVGSPSVIDLVKHGSCHIGFYRGKGVLLVKKRGIFHRIDGEKIGTVRGCKYQFVEDAFVIRGYNSQIPQAVADVNPVPGKDGFGDGVAVYDFPGPGHLVECGEGEMPCI